MNLNHIKNIVTQFQIDNSDTDIQEFGNGNINQTFLVTSKTSNTNKANHSNKESRFILQRINTDVFTKPELVMQNMSMVTEHIHKAIHDSSTNSTERSDWQTPIIIQTNTVKNYYLAPDKSVWRMISFIENSQSYDIIDNEQLAEEVGKALGTFHKLINTLPAEGLADTLEGFHITPEYVAHYDDIMTNFAVHSMSGLQKEFSSEIGYCQEFISARRAIVDTLENAKKTGDLPLRIMHGDPKVNNIMIDKDTGKAVSVVDLDTVKPGLIHYDIGDCLRSGCNPLGEEAGEQWQSVYFNCDNCRAILTGYLAEAKDFFTSKDYEYIYDSIRLLAFELGVRFFADYLEGNVYFKAINYPEHNLHRALVQFQLAKSIEQHKDEIEEMIRTLKVTYEV